MHVLVTGGNGFLGGALVQRLLDYGHSVFSLGRKKKSNSSSKAVFIQCDLKDSKSTLSACKGMDAIFHVAAVPGIWGDSKEFFASNVEGTRNILEGCFQADVKKLIYTSSPSVVCHNQDLVNVDETSSYPESYLCDYSQTKAIAEREV